MNKFKLSQVLLVLGLMGGSVMASAQIDPWTAVGSTGTVDDADTAILDTIGVAVQLRSTAPAPATLDLRYNIVAVDGVFSPGDGVAMRVRFRDNGAGARVVVRLFEVPFSTGIPVLRLTLDSNAFGAAAGFQNQTAVTCSGNFFNFLNNAYFIHVTMNKSDATGNPGLQLLQVSGALC